MGVQYKGELLSFAKPNECKMPLRSKSGTQSTQGTTLPAELITEYTIRQACNAVQVTKLDSLRSKLVYCWQSGLQEASALLVGWVAHNRTTGRRMPKPNIAWILDVCKLPGYAAVGCGGGYVREALRYVRSSSALFRSGPSLAQIVFDICLAVLE